MDPNMELKTNCTKSTLQKIRGLSTWKKNATRVCWQEKTMGIENGPKNTLSNKGKLTHDEVN